MASTSHMSHTHAKANTTQITSYTYVHHLLCRGLFTRCKIHTLLNLYTYIYHIILLDIDIIYIYSSVCCQGCESSSGDNNNNNNNAPATDSTIGIIIGVVVAVVVLIVVLIVVTAVVVGVKVKRNRSTQSTTPLTRQEG